MFGLKRIDRAIWLMEKEGEMRTDALVIGTNKIVSQLGRDKTLEQLRNVASLPGIVGEAVLMPDAHEGYGFPIGGVAAFDGKEGIISPGGIGFDINCGVRLLKTPLRFEEIKDKIRELTDLIFREVPSGVGSTGKLNLSISQLDEVLARGVKWAIENGYGKTEDIERIEENGSMNGDPEFVSQKAKERGKDQLGTLGAGNHFLELEKVDKIFDEETAKKFGLFEGQFVILIHTGSRGLGHQVASDYIFTFLGYARKRGIRLKDKELVYADLNSVEAERYIKAMKCAVNFAFTNREIITHWTREAVAKILGIDYDEIELLYDVAHNIAKFEKHKVNGEERELVVHRKGATRAFPKGRKELPAIYRSIGQPVLIPGSMGTASYVLVGEEKGLEISFGSTCHGSGRTMSRREATRRYYGKEVEKRLLERGIYIRAQSLRVVAEETPEAYKNVDEVVRSVEEAGISRIVAKMIPKAVVKG